MLMFIKLPKIKLPKIPGVTLGKALDAVSPVKVFDNLQSGITKATRGRDSGSSSDNVAPDLSSATVIPQIPANTGDPSPMLRQRFGNPTFNKIMYFGSDWLMSLGLSRQNARLVAWWSKIIIAVGSAVVLFNAKAPRRYKLWR